VHTLEVAHDNEYALFVAVAIKAAMYYRGLSTEELARLLGLHVETIRRWLRADTVLSAGDASRLSATLDVPSDLLMRPPTTRERALAMIAAYDALREDGSRP
jgi:transcriptional regulator with XRE-family HTH domain